MLGYHLRAAGERDPGINNHNGPLTERALIAFQLDYRPPAALGANVPQGPLRVRGELGAHPEISQNLDAYKSGNGRALNDSAKDSAQTQAALSATVGG